MANKTADQLFDEQPSADDLFEAGGDRPTSRLSSSGGVQRLELHKVAPDTSDVDSPEGAQRIDVPWGAGDTQQDYDVRVQKALTRPLSGEPARDYDSRLRAATNPAGQRSSLDPRSSTGAFAHGVEKGGTLGFGDELYGALDADSRANERRQRLVNETADAKRRGTYDPSAGAPPLPSFTSWQLKRDGQPTLSQVRLAHSPNDLEHPRSPSWTEDYRAGRDSLREDNDAAEQEHPALFAAGEFAGSAALPLPGPGKAKGLAKVGKYALQGAGVGAASALGNSKADLTQGDGGGALLDTVTGGAGGAVLGGALGYGASKLDPVLERAAARRAYKALDPYMKTMQANLRGRLGREPTPAEMMRAIEKLGGRALSENVIPQGPLERWANPETLGNRAAIARDDAGALKGGFVDMAQDQLGGRPVKLEDLAGSVDTEALKAGQSPATQQLSRALLGESKGIRTAGVNRALAGEPIDYTLPEMEKLKTQLQRAVFGLDVARRGGPTQHAKEIVARLAKEAGENAVEKGLGPDELAQFQALKGKYGDLSSIADTAGYGAMRDFRNAVVGLGDRQAAGVGAELGKDLPEKVIGSAILGAANRLGRTRGSAAAARTLSNMSQSSTALSPAANELAPYLNLLRNKPDDTERNR